MITENLFEVVNAMERKVWDAVVERDAAALAGLFADDYIEITADGKRVAKGQVVDLSPKVDEIDRYDIDSESVIPLEDYTVLLSYHLTLEGKCRGYAVSPKERWVTSIWSRIDGQWLCRFFQQSPFQ